MKTIRISDITLREIDRGRSAALSFKERLEITRTLDRLQADAIELPPIRDAKADALRNKTIASLVAFAQLTADEKNAVSHRGKALEAFKEKLEEYLG